MKIRKPTKVYCDNCWSLVVTQHSGLNGEWTEYVCTAPQNVRHTDSWLRREIETPQKHPSELNGQNQCPWYLENNLK